MARETAPAFQFYVKEWRSSRAIMRMTFAQRGMYLEMLLEQWENLSLPDDPRAICELIGGDEAEWIAAWPVLRRKFSDRRVVNRDDETPAVHDPSDWDASRRIVNPKLEHVRRERKSFTRTARKGGLARAKSATRGKDGTYVPADEPAGSPAGSPAAIQPPTSTASASASATASPTASASAKAAGAPPLVGRQRPLMDYPRLGVFPWMRDECLQMLGATAIEFDLDAWLLRLDLSGEPLPARIWPWLKERVEADARQRGLLRPPAALGKQTTRLAQALANIKAEEARGGVS